MHHGGFDLINSPTVSVSAMQVKQIHSICEIAPAAWNALLQDDYPFLRHEFLTALELSGTVTELTGWKPCHLLVYDQQTLVAAMPMYQKTHSYGEYVFDYQWADAYRRYGLPYYPKWLAAIPFTPCPGPRLAYRKDADPEALMMVIVDHIRDQAPATGISSWHCLFSLPDLVERLQSEALLVREGVQFHWFNRGYRDFADYLDGFTAAKRKTVRRERRKVAEAGIEFKRISGREATIKDWEMFYRFYAQTYRKNRSLPYLNREFFLRCAVTMGEKVMLTQAVRQGETVAATLSFVGGDTLYGRYWGASEPFDALHFEACYYQGLDYCLENRLRHYDAGAQGEHKIARGFEPVATYSLHWLREPAFADVLRPILAEERQIVGNYRRYAALGLPFKK